MITHRSSISVLVTLALAACATAPPRATPTPGPSELAAARPDPPPRPAAAQQTDYSPAGLFHDAHGDFYDSMQRFKPSARVRFRGLPGANLESENGEFDSWQVGGEGVFPLITDPDSVVLLGALYDARWFEADSTFGAPLPGVEDETVHAIGLHLGYGHFFTDDVYIEGLFSPGVYSDLDGGLKSDDWKWYGRALATIRQSEDLFYRVGVEVTDVFEDVPVYGLAGIAWRFHPSWRLDVLLPREAELSLLIDAATTLFLGVSLDGNEYHIRSHPSTGKIESDILTQELAVYLGGIHRFTDNFSAYGRFGAAVAGSYEFQTATSGTIDGQIEPTLMFEVGLGWDF